MAREREEETRRMLAELRGELDTWTVPEPPQLLVEQTLQHAGQALRESRAPSPRPSQPPTGFPVGFKRELLRLLAVSAPALALAVAWNLLVLTRGPGLLDPWLPELVARAVPTAYALGAAGWLALALGSLPLLAHRRALTRHSEAPA